MLVQMIYSRIFKRISALLLACCLVVDPTTLHAFSSPEISAFSKSPSATQSQALTLTLGGALFATVLLQQNAFLDVFHKLTTMPNSVLLSAGAPMLLGLNLISAMKTPPASAQPPMNLQPPTHKGDVDRLMSYGDRGILVLDKALRPPQEGGLPLQEKELRDSIWIKGIDPTTPIIHARDSSTRAAKPLKSYERVVILGDTDRRGNVSIEGFQQRFTAYPNTPFALEMEQGIPKRIRFENTGIAFRFFKIVDADTGQVLGTHLGGIKGPRFRNLKNAFVETELNSSSQLTLGGNKPTNDGEEPGSKKIWATFKGHDNERGIVHVQEGVVTRFKSLESALDESFALVWSRSKQRYTTSFYQTIAQSDFNALNGDHEIHNFRTNSFAQVHWGRLWMTLRQQDKGKPVRLFDIRNPTGKRAFIMAAEVHEEGHKPWIKRNVGIYSVLPGSTDQSFERGPLLDIYTYANFQKIMRSAPNKFTCIIGDVPTNHSGDVFLGGAYLGKFASDEDTLLDFKVVKGKIVFAQFTYDVRPTIINLNMPLRTQLHDRQLSFGVSRLHRRTTPSFSPEVFVEIVESIGQNREGTQARLIENFLWLINKLTRRYAGPESSHYEDFVQEGVIALLDGIDVLRVASVTDIQGFEHIAGRLIEHRLAAKRKLLGLKKDGEYSLDAPLSPKHNTVRASTLKDYLASPSASERQLVEWLDWQGHAENLTAENRRLLALIIDADFTLDEAADLLHIPVKKAQEQLLHILNSRKNSRQDHDSSYAPAFEKIVDTALILCVIGGMGLLLTHLRTIAVTPVEIFSGIAVMGIWLATSVSKGAEARAPSPSSTELNPKQIMDDIAMKAREKPFYRASQRQFETLIRIFKADNLTSDGLYLNLSELWPWEWWWKAILLRSRGFPKHFVRRDILDQAVVMTQTDHYRSHEFFHRMYFLFPEPIKKEFIEVWNQLNHVQRKDFEDTLRTSHYPKRAMPQEFFAFAVTEGVLAKHREARGLVVESARLLDWTRSERALQNLFRKYDLVEIIQNHIEQVQWVDIPTHPLPPAHDMRRLWLWGLLGAGLSSFFHATPAYSASLIDTLWERISNLSEPEITLIAGITLRLLVRLIAPWRRSMRERSKAKKLAKLAERQAPSTALNPKPPADQTRSPSKTTSIALFLVFLGGTALFSELQTGGQLHVLPAGLNSLLISGVLSMLLQNPQESLVPPLKQNLLAAA